ncbi:MAG: extracellular solute-binding protein [Deltaproteobacteria bacterium]|nr:extracellular solute-binding protein [Deltaproteobacteria bacterium]
MRRASALGERLVALVLVLALVDAPTAAAQEPTGDDPRPEVVLWHAYRAREQEALERFVLELNQKETRFRVTVLAVPYDAYLDKITAAIPRGRGPDVFVAAHDTIGDWAEAKTIDVVDDLLDPSLVAQLQPGLVAAVLYRGHAYGVPLAFKSVALWRNTALVPDAPATLAELEAAAKKNTGDGRYGLVYENRLFYFHAPFLFGFGGGIFDDTGRPTLDAATNIESVRYAQRLARELAVVPQETNGALVTSLFVEGKAAMILNGPWALGDVGDAVPLAVSPLPKTNDGRPLKPFLSVEAAFISGKTSKRALAVELVRALAGPECSRRRLVEGAQPVALRAAWDDLGDSSKDAPILRAFLAQQQDAIPTPNTPAMKSVWSPFDLALGASLGQGLDPAQPLAEAQAKVAAVVHAIETGPQRGSRSGFIIFVVVTVALLGGAVVIGVLRYGTRRLVRDAVRQKAAYLYTAPAMIGMGLLVFVPFAVGIGMGFFEHTWGSYTFVGLENFRRILAGGDSRFFTTLGMTVLWTASNVFLHVVIGVFLALLLSQARLRFRALYRVLFIVPWAVPNYITALIWKGMFHPELGAINQALGLTGFSWMNETWSAFLANLITNTWLGFPFMMVIALGGLTSIPNDLYEAAALDGASAWQRFTSITLPLLLPTLAPAIVLGTVWTFNMFNVIYLVSGGAPQGKTDILITEAFRWAFERGQGGAFGYAAAYSALVFLMLVGYTTAANRVAAKVAEVRP